MSEMEIAPAGAGKKRRPRRQRSTERRADVKASTSVKGGQFRPLSSADCQQIDAAARLILSKTGLSEAPESVIKIVNHAGGSLSSDQRLLFPKELVDSALKGIRKDVVLHGQIAGYELDLTGANIQMGSGGAAPYILDINTDKYRESNLQDLYDAARIVDSLDNIHFFSRSMVARDMPTLSLLDINTAYASLSGTGKHVCVPASEVASVKPIVDLVHLLAGSEQVFNQRPFLSLLVNHAVPPLRFDAESCEVLLEAARLGIPIHANTFGQMGASSPVTMAGCLAQTVAETLAGMIIGWLANPQVPLIFGTRPMLTDLRTGAMTGGSGEQALLMAATAQMARYYDLPGSTIAGATDSKVADAQSGYEKCQTVLMAAQAGSNMITQACGMHASLMACALESYIIDNDMLGGILRSLVPIKVNQNTLAVNTIDQVVRGEGHFLGEADTLARMQSDFLYPDIADRQNFEEWEKAGAHDIREIAKQKTREILDNHYPDHIPGEMDAAIRRQFDIRLPAR
ncbi:MAG: trimethylamine--corrinoid protein Co-methyltransferase [Parasphingorhabdus sp.]|jgi:trimethylamine--corrinoid protein Co-methyltransferase